MRILVIGGGIAARRYVEPLLWTQHEIDVSGIGVVGASRKLAEEFGLCYYPVTSLDKEQIDKYGMIIICLSLEKKYEVISRLINDLEYKNAIIIEKPLSILEDEIEKYREILYNVEKCAIVCQRNFDIEHYSIEKDERYKIKWFSINNELISSIIHMLPHLLSWLMIEIGNDIELEQDGDDLKGVINGKELVIRFIRSKEVGIEINGKRYSSPNYRILNCKIVEAVNQFQCEDSRKNIDIALQVSKLISKLLEGKDYENRRIKI